MSSQDAAKLSKKQRKALAFRERKGKRAQDQLDLPELDVADDETIVPSLPTSTKRKREEGEDAPVKATKKPKQSPSGNSESTKEAEVSEATTKKDKKNNRYILFVGAYGPCGSSDLSTNSTIQRICGYIQGTFHIKQVSNPYKLTLPRVPIHPLSVCSLPNLTPVDQTFPSPNRKVVRS